MVTSMEMVVKAAKDSKDGYYDMRFLEVMVMRAVLHVIYVPTIVI